jgi:cytidyltransferase-like protein
MRTKNIFDLETLFRMTYDLKKAGKKVGISHGAFDLFHVSHLDMLQRSSRVCDFLIVGIDSDENVSNYKSYKRPIIGQEDRMRIVNELNCVEAVFLNDLELNPEEFTQLYKELNVAIVTTGRKFGFQGIIEEQVAHANAKLIQFNTKQSPSTSKIIDKILKTYK